MTRHGGTFVCVGNIFVLRGNFGDGVATLNEQLK
jgi:hypothetical protein